MTLVIAQNKSSIKARLHTHCLLDDLAMVRLIPVHLREFQLRWVRFGENMGARALPGAIGHEIICWPIIGMGEMEIDCPGREMGGISENVAGTGENYLGAVRNIYGHTGTWQ